MECCSGDNYQSINGSTSNEPDAEGVPLFFHLLIHDRYTNISCYCDNSSCDDR